MQLLQLRVKQLVLLFLPKVGRRIAEKDSATERADFVHTAEPPILQWTTSIVTRASGQTCGLYLEHMELRTLRPCKRLARARDPRYGKRVQILNKRRQFQRRYIKPMAVGFKITAFSGCNAHRAPAIDFRLQPRVNTSDRITSWSIFNAERNRRTQLKIIGHHARFQNPLPAGRFSG